MPLNHGEKQMPSESFVFLSKDSEEGLGDAGISSGLVSVSEVRLGEISKPGLNTVMR